ncbi:MAG: SurA N-terminal domain-containing protein [Pseudomonadota bacterium]
MLTALRRGASTTVAKVFLVLISVAVVAGLGFGGYFGNIGQRTVLAVGNAEISAETFQIALRRQINTLSQQLGTPLTAEQARLFGVDRQLLSQLASEAALDSETERLNIGVSDGRLAERIASDPIFLQTGGFNRQFFRQVLFSYGITEEDFVADTRSFAARQQLAQALVGGLEPSTTMLEVANRFANELRTVSFLTLDEMTLSERPEPTMEELSAFFDERIGDYRAPEYRSIVYLSLSEEALADPQAVSADEVQAAYDAELDVLTSAGERDVTQLLFPEAGDALQALTRLQDGVAVVDLQADDALTVQVTELGAVTRSNILDEAAGDAAFALEAPGPTDVIDGRFGSVIMVVNRLIEDSVTSLADVEDRLRLEIAQANARDEIFSLFDAVEDARAAGDTLQEIAGRFSLELKTVAAMDDNGLGPDGQPVDLPVTDSLIAETFQSDVGLENDAIDTADRGFLWFEVTGVEDARERTFQEAEDRVRVDWAANQLDDLLRARAGELVQDLERGRTLETLSIALDLPLTVTEPFTRGEAPDALGGQAAVAAFEGGEGHVGDVNGPPNADGETLTRLVFVVDDVTRPAFFENASDVQRLSAELGPTLEDTILTQYVGALQASLGVRVDQELVQQLVSGQGF